MFFNSPTLKMVHSAKDYKNKQLVKHNRPKPFHENNSIDIAGA